MAAILRAQEAVLENQADDVINHLSALASAKEAMCFTLDRMPERCAPFLLPPRKTSHSRLEKQSSPVQWTGV